MKDNGKPAVAAPRLAAVVVFSGLLIGAGVAIVSCERKDAAQSAAPKRAADRTYTTRGEIRMLPAPKRPTAQLVIHHEPIDDFQNPDGTRGMASMEMPFTPIAGVSLDGFAIGDSVEFDLAVWYGPDGKTIDSHGVTRMQKLPKDTRLHFGAAAPTLGVPAGK